MTDRPWNLWRFLSDHTGALLVYVFVAFPVGAVAGRLLFGSAVGAWAGILLAVIVAHAYMTERR